MILTCYPLTIPFKWPSMGQIKVKFTVEKPPEMVFIHLVFVCQTTAADSKRFLDAHPFQKAKTNFFLDISKILSILSQPNFINILIYTCWIPRNFRKIQVFTLKILGIQLIHIYTSCPWFSWYFQRLGCSQLKRETVCLHSTSFHLQIFWTQFSNG